MMDSDQSRDDAAHANSAANEAMTEPKNPEVSAPGEEGTPAASPEQLHLPANPPFAPEPRDQAAEAATRVA